MPSAHTGRLGILQRPGKLRMGQPVGRHRASALARHHKHRAGLIALLNRPGQLAQMANPSQSGRIRKQGHPVLHQGNALNLTEDAFFLGFQIKIQSGFTLFYLTPDSNPASKGHPALHPFLKNPVNHLAIDIDPFTQALDGHQVKGGFPLFAFRAAQRNPGLRQQELPQPPGILYMAFALNAANPTFRREPVEPL